MSGTLPMKLNCKCQKYHLNAQLQIHVKRYFDVTVMIVLFEVSSSSSLLYDGFEASSLG
uniref:Predicted protein n=1 Tax=Hordeum vulgare subsp. vulgare TaxID=112509 RepID=F2ECF3_HORVV|nr:predicted protein [Hordeum vulgare subsp. vulgare]